MSIPVSRPISNSNIIVGSQIGSTSQVSRHTPNTNTMASQAGSNSQTSENFLGDQSQNSVSYSPLPVQTTTTIRSRTTDQNEMQFKIPEHLMLQFLMLRRQARREDIDNREGDGN